MKILILTSINPIYAGWAYSEISRTIKDKDFLCFPFFAYLDAEEKQRLYLPTFFAMIEESLKPKTHAKIYKRNTIVIGNTYKDEKFDIIVALDDRDVDSLPFDYYIEALEKNEEFKDFKEKIRLNDLYKIEDAKLVFHTIRHLVLFLEGADKKNEIKQ